MKALSKPKEFLRSKRKYWIANLSDISCAIQSICLNSGMVEIESLEVEYAAKSKELAKLHMEMEKKAKVVTALFNLIEAIKGEPPSKTSAKSGNNGFLVPGSVANIPQAIRGAIPPAGKAFMIDDILPVVQERFPNADRKTVSFTLWSLAKNGELKTVTKGKRGTPAKYARS